MRHFHKACNTQRVSHSNDVFVDAKVTGHGTLIAPQKRYIGVTQEVSIISGRMGSLGGYGTPDKPRSACFFQAYLM